MVKIKLYRYIVIAFLTCSTMVSCNSWLDIQPTDAVTDDVLFSSKQGFYQALNGVYLDLNQPELYGGTLLCSDIEVLAQRYDIPSENPNLADLAKYNYKGTYAKETFQNSWDKAYALILTVNKILARTDTPTGKNILPAADYNMIRGELYALRAMLHFDMLRLFGPVMKIDDKAISIPYSTSSEVVVTDLLPANVVIKRIIDDLTRSSVALQQDPIVNYGPLFGSVGSDNNGRYRTLRLNYYAVKALQARVYLYGMPSDPSYKAKAFNICKEIIAENDAKNWFKFVTMSDLQAASPDRIFSNEVLFMNQNNRRVDIHKRYFDPSISTTNILAPKEDALAELYSESDYRYKNLWLTSNEKSYRCFYKYAPVKDSLKRDLVPMIRLSEVYLIAAETADTPAEGITKYLNVLLQNRLVIPLSADDDINVALEKEYQREFFGEGQLFYFFKRNNTSELPGSNMVMSPSNYVLPLPDSEIKYR